MANVSSFSGAMPVIPGGLVELGYSQIVADVTVDNATAGTGKEVIAPLTVVCDGGPVLVEFFSPYVRGSNTATDEVRVSLFQDGSELVREWGRTTTVAADYQRLPYHLSYRVAPTAGSHTFSVKAYVTNASRTGLVGAANTTTGSAPAFLRVSKIVNQNDGLKPFWTPPVVTQLPTQATEGDQVLLYSSSPYAGYQTHQYVTGSWRTLDDSRATGAWTSFTPTFDAASGGVNLGTGGTKTGAYLKLGRTVMWRANITMGTKATAAAGTGGYEITLPGGTSNTGGYPIVANGWLYDGTFYPVICDGSAGATKARFIAGGYGTPIGSTQFPIASTTTWILTVAGMYEATA